MLAVDINQRTSGSSSTRSGHRLPFTYTRWRPERERIRLRIRSVSRADEVLRPHVFEEGMAEGQMKRRFKMGFVFPERICSAEALPPPTSRSHR